MYYISFGLKGSSSKVMNFTFDLKKFQKSLYKHQKSHYALEWVNWQLFTWSRSHYMCLQFQYLCVYGGWLGFVVYDLCINDAMITNNHIIKINSHKKNFVKVLTWPPWDVLACMQASSLCICMQVSWLFKNGTFASIFVILVKRTISMCWLPLT